MIRNGDYRNIQADDVQDVRLLSYEHTITRNMANIEIPLQDGLYNFINENVPSRHFYGYIQNEKIRDVYFDQDQINHVDELIMAEYSKTEILSKQAFHYSIQHQEINEQLKNAEKLVITSGIRANDMATRLKYAGIPQERIIIEPSIMKAIQIAGQAPTGEHITILPSYTALLKINKEKIHD